MSIYQVPIAPPITPESIIIEGDNNEYDNNNNNDNNDKNGNIIGVHSEIYNTGVHNSNKASLNDKNSNTPGVKSEIAGVNAKISGVTWVIYEALVYIPVDKYINETLDEDNEEISNGKEFHNGKILSKDAYNPNVYPKSTMTLQKRV